MDPKRLRTDREKRDRSRQRVAGRRRSPPHVTAKRASSTHHTQNGNGWSTIVSCASPSLPHGGAPVPCTNVPSTQHTKRDPFPLLPQFLPRQRRRQGWQRPVAWNRGIWAFFGRIRRSWTLLDMGRRLPRPRVPPALAGLTDERKNRYDTVLRSLAGQDRLRITLARRSWG